MTWVMVDVEADGPCPGLYSMVSLGAVVVEPSLDRTFYGQLQPVSDVWIPEALAVSGHTRDECMDFPHPATAMYAFRDWLESLQGKPRFVADNNGFDWQFVNYYFHRFTRQPVGLDVNPNPFGYSSTNLGSLYKGMVKDMRKNFKHLRKTKHTHHPVDDAKGNAEAMLAMKAKGLKI